MLKKLFQVFRPPKTPALPDPDAELALGALLVRVAQSDRDYQLEEISLIDRILARLYQHDAIGAAKVRAACEKLHAAAPETDTFGRLIRETTGLEERLAALDALWEVVLADSHEHPGEIRIVEDARKAMGLSRADSDTARARARGKLLSPDIGLADGQPPAENSAIKDASEATTPPANPDREPQP
ncbi:TerB family tellurite resistance protein [Phaeobacter sp. C3_T13_0]|uniref:tellurite resistance TerB family protein n=1 Tax=Phaeobacter cretensis TaxID=3342641 RepID=UPI0039BD0DC5